MSQLPFQYWALDARGGKTSGVMKAPSRQDAYRRIAATGLTPTRIVQATERDAAAPGKRWRRGVSAQEVAHFTYQLSVLLEARIPVVDCFRSIAEQEPNHAFRRIILEVAAAVQGGQGITDALTPHRALFGEVYLQTVRAAETSGNMIKVLAHLAEQVEEQTEMRRAVKGALMYPATVVIALFFGTGFLVTFVVPRFAEMFRGRGVALPFLTEALDTLGTSVRSYWYLYLAALAGSFLLARLAWCTPASRIRIEALLHRVPLLGDILTGLAVGRFASVFGLCLSSGLGLLDTLEMAGKASGRPLLRDDVAVMIRQVKAGGRLGEVLQKCAYLPGFVKQLFRAGEESAELTRMCQIVSRHYVRETRHLVKNASTVIEPVLIALLTGVVLVVALAIFLPMWSMMSLMQ